MVWISTVLKTLFRPLDNLLFDSLLFSVLSISFRGVGTVHVVIFFELSVLFVVEFFRGFYLSSGLHRG